MAFKLAGDQYTGIGLIQVRQNYNSFVVDLNYLVPKFRSLLDRLYCHDLP